MNVVNILLQLSRRSVRASECVGAFIVYERTYCAFEIISDAVQEEKVFSCELCASDNKVSNFHALIATKPGVFSARFVSH